MKIATFLVSCTLLLLPATSSTVILKPAAGKAGSPVGLIFIQGAFVAPNLYTPVCQAIQQAFPHPLWVGIPEFLDDFPEPIQFQSAVTGAIDALVQAGFDKTSPLIMGAHSLGSVVLSSVNANFSGEVKAQFLLGGYIDRSDRHQNVNITHFNYSTPTLSIAGSLDGLARVTRMAEQFYVQLTRESANRGQPNGVLDPNLIRDFPVVVVPGMNHWQSASGTPTSRVKKYDLKAEITQTQAYTTIAQLTSAYMLAQLGDMSGEAVIKNAVVKTQEFIQPIVTSLLLENSYHFEDPCNCYNTICNVSKICSAGSPWTHAVSSPTMAGVSSDKLVTFANMDSFHHVSTVLPKPPYVHEPFLLGECKLGQACNLTMVTISQNIYEDQNNPIFNDDGLVRTGAIEIRTKLVSRQKVLRNRGYDNATTPFNKTDGVNNCGNINQLAIDWAMKNADKTTLDRYNEYGEKMVIGKDLEHGDGPQWIWIQLNYTEITNGNDKYLLVRSNSMKTCEACLAPGYHYCKVLSPAFVMDWMYTDSLRWKRGI